MLNILCKHCYCDFAKIPQSFFPCLNQHIFSPRRRRCQYYGLNFKQIKYKRSQNLTSKRQPVKNLKIAKTFSKDVNKEATYFFKEKLFSFSQYFLSVYLHKPMYKKWAFSLRVYLVNVNISA